MRLRWKLAALVCTTGLCLTTARAEEFTFLSLEEVPIPKPTVAVIPVPDPKAADPASVIPGPETDLDFKDVNDVIVKDQHALVQLGKALFWDMQAGSDGVQSCASCHFNAGADSRSRNQISPGLHDDNFPGLNKDDVTITGDTAFGNSTVPYTARDPHTPNPPGPKDQPPARLDVPGFPQFAPNHQLTAKDFPLNDWLRPTELTPRGPHTAFLDEFANVSRDTNDVVSSQGVRHTIFKGVKPGQQQDDGTASPDIFNLDQPGHLDVASRVRRVAPRNAPTVINAVYNFDNFWDGRASFIFNGVNPFGFRDRRSTLMQVVDGEVRNVFLRITNSSLASQAVGPTTSNFEMSWENRTFPDVGKRMLSMNPLHGQLVHPQDSVLGPASQARLDAHGKVTGDPGLYFKTYSEMVKAAFKEQWWDSTYTVKPEAVTIQKPSIYNPRTIARSQSMGIVTRNPTGKAPNTMEPNEYSMMEWNFSLFWALAIQAYETTLISDDTPFDRFQGAPSKGKKGDPGALTASERNGLTIFNDADPNLGGRCNNCHALPITTNHSVVDILQQDIDAPNFQGRPHDILEFMVMGDGRSANYDKGFYNIGVRRTTEDVSRGAPVSGDPVPKEFQNPKDGYKAFPLSYTALAHLAMQNRLPNDVLRFIQLDPITRKPVPVLDRQAINGNFKAPNLRNVKFTGPYFHNGDSATLRQVVEFYTRGGNFPNTNFHDLDVDIFGIPGLMFPEFRPSAQQNIHDLVEFLSHGLTDERVSLEKAPFDHPQLYLPNGSDDNDPTQDVMIEIPAVGQNGRTESIATFLDLKPQQP